MATARVLPVLALFLGLTACGAVEPLPPCPPVARAAPPLPTSAASAPPPAQAFAEPGLEPTFADPERRKKLEATFPALDALIEAEMRGQRAPGMVLGIVIDGELSYSRGFGVVDLEQPAKPDADTVYRIASITKSFIGLTLLALRDEGALGLDDSLARWLPEAAGLVYPTRDATPITLRQLLTHTSGLPRTAKIEPEEAPAESDVTRVLAGFALESPPGTRYLYSNFGFSLLGLAAGRVARAPLREVVGKRLLTPLGMTSTVWDRTDLPAGKLATPYERGPKGEPQKTVPLRLGAPEGAGGLFSSLRDMARYVAFQLSAYPPRDTPDSGPLRRSTVREAHSTGQRSGLNVQVVDAAKKGDALVRVSADSYGFGWGSTQTCDFDDLVSHNGAIDGFTSDIRFLPTRGVGVVALANYFGADPGVISSKVLRALAQGGGLTKRALPVSPALGAAMAKLLGVYTTWDEAAYAAMLGAGRKKFPEEKAEIEGYRRLHGACKGYSPLEIESPQNGRFSMDCERGTLQMALSIAKSDGGIMGFAGKSLDIEVPKAQRTVAERLASLVGKWDERLYKKHIAPKATKPRDETAGFFEKVRNTHGACTVKSAVHEVFEQWFVLECERGGDMTLAVTLDAKDENAVTSFAFRPAGRGVCPVR